MADSNDITVAARNLDHQRVTHKSSMGEILKLWSDVAESLAKHKTVAWAQAADSLTIAHHYLHMSADARSFVDKYMCQIVDILLEQNPATIGQMEKECVKRCLECSLQIVDEDLKASNSSKSIAVAPSIAVLELIFGSRKIYKRLRDSQPPGGHGVPAEPPNLRVSMIEFFRRINGSNLVEYLERHATTPQFPSMILIIVLLKAFLKIDSVYEEGISRDIEKWEVNKKEAIQIANSTMKHILSLDDTSTGAVPTLTALLWVFSRWCPAKITDFCVFWRAFALKIIMSSDPSAKEVGWDMIYGLIDHSLNMRPPPRAYIVSGAGTGFVNGRYCIDSAKISDGGYQGFKGKLMYHRHIPADAEGEGAGKTLTLFRCTMRSQHRWWFLSEVDENQPGTDQDTDYYLHKSKRHEEAMPSLSGWLTCGAGVDPAPSLKKIGMLTPDGEQHNTLEHQLAKWAIENKLVELAVEELSQKEVSEIAFHGYTALIKFLAKMCYEFDWLYDDDGLRMNTDIPSNQFCLKESHLLLAKENIMTSTDTMVLTQMYRLLLSVHDSLPEHLQQLALHITQSAVMRRIQFNDPTLFELQVGSNLIADPTKRQVGVYDTSDGADFAMLSNSIGNNTHLKVVHFDGRLVEVPSEVFEGLKHNSSIKKLKLHHSPEWLGNAILDTFNHRNGNNLTGITLWNCEIGNGGIHTLSSTLGTCSLLKSIGLQGSAIDDAQLEQITSAIQGHRELFELNLSGNTIGAAGCEVLANLLKDKRCNLQLLNLDHNPFGSNGVIILASALPHNTTLFKLSIVGNDASIMSSQDAFLKAVCDTSSVTATYLSNHTIETITFGVPINEDLGYWLDLHQLNDKHAIAILKVIRKHRYIAMEPLFEWDVHVLPDVVSWFDDAIEALEGRVGDGREENLHTIGKMKLSAIYEFVRAMPLMSLPAWHGAKRKRKRSSRN